MSTIIIITPPPKGQTATADLDGFAQRQPIGSPYTEALRAIEQAELDGSSVRIIEA